MADQSYCPVCAGGLIVSGIHHGIDLALPAADSPAILHCPSCDKSYLRRGGMLIEFDEEAYRRKETKR